MIGLANGFHKSVNKTELPSSNDSYSNIFSSMIVDSILPTKVVKKMQTVYILSGKIREIKNEKTK